MGSEASTPLVSDEDIVADLLLRIDDVGRETRRVKELIAATNAIATELTDQSSAKARSTIHKRFTEALAEAERSSAAIEEKLQLIVYEVKTTTNIHRFDETRAEMDKIAVEFSAMHAELVALSKSGIAKPKVPAMRPRPSSIAKSQRKGRRLASGNSEAPKVPTASRPSSMLIMTAIADHEDNTNLTKAEDTDAAFPAPTAVLSLASDSVSRHTSVDTANPLASDSSLFAMASMAAESERREEEEFAAPSTEEAAAEEEAFVAPAVEL